MMHLPAKRKNNLRKAVSQANRDESRDPHVVLIITGFPCGTTIYEWNRQVAVMSTDCDDTEGLRMATEAWRGPHDQWNPSKLCWNHLGLNGKVKPCMHGARCDGLHMSDEALDKYFKSVPCMNVSPLFAFVESMECLKAGCPYAHSLQELKDSPIKLTTLVPAAPLVIVRVMGKTKHVDPNWISYTIGAASLVTAHEAEIRPECHNLSCPYGLACDSVHLRRRAAVPRVRAAAGAAMLAPPNRGWGPPDALAPAQMVPTPPPPPKAHHPPPPPPKAHHPPLNMSPSNAPLVPESWDSEEDDVRDDDRYTRSLDAQISKSPNPWEPMDGKWLQTMMIQNGVGSGEGVELEELNWNSLSDVVGNEEDLVNHERGLLWDFIPRYEAWWKQSLESPEHHKAQIKNNILLYPQCILGEGRTSSVCLGFRVENGTPVAVKRFKKVPSKALQELLTRDDRRGEHNEIALMTRRQLFHGLVRYITHFTMKQEENARRYDSVCIVMDCLNSDLWFVISRWKKDVFFERLHGSPEHVKVIQHVLEQLIKVILEVGTIQDSGGNVLVHRDINPKNVMFDVHGHAKLIDVGISRRLQQEERSLLISHNALPANGYYPREFFEYHEEGGGYVYGSKSDVYSLGRVALALMVRDPDLLELEKGREAALKTSFCTKAPHHGACLLDLIQNMIPHQIEDRIDLTDAARHPFFWHPLKTMVFLANVGSVIQDDNLSHGCKNKLWSALDKSAKEVHEGWQISQGWRKFFGPEASTNFAKFIWVDKKGGNSGQYSDHTWYTLFDMIRDHAPGHHSPFMEPYDIAVLLDCVPFLVQATWRWVVKEGDLSRHLNFLMFCSK